MLPVSTQIPESAASPLQTLASQPEALRSWRKSRCVGEISGNHGPLHIQKCPNNSPMAATPMASFLQLQRSLLVSIPIWKLCPSAARRDFAIEQKSGKWFTTQEFITIKSNENHAYKNPTQSQPVILLSSSLFTPDFWYLFDHRKAWLIWFQERCQMVKWNNLGISGHALGSLFRLFF